MDLFINTIISKTPREVLATLTLGKQQVWEGAPAGLAYSLSGSEGRFQENEWNLRARSVHFHGFQ